MKMFTVTVKHSANQSRYGKANIEARTASEAKNMAIRAMMKGGMKGATDCWFVSSVTEARYGEIQFSPDDNHRFK